MSLLSHTTIIRLSSSYHPVWNPETCQGISQRKADKKKISTPCFKVNTGDIFCLPFYQLFDWATHQGAAKDRLITFYHLANRWETATQSQKTRLYHSTAVHPLLVLQRSWSICSFSLRVTLWRMLLSYWKATVKEGKVSLDKCSFPRMCGQNPSGSPKLVHTTRNVWIGAPSKLLGHTPGLLQKLLTITLTTKQRQAKPYCVRHFPYLLITYLRHPHRAEVLCITRGKTRAPRYWRFLRLTVGCSLKLHNSHCLYSSIIIFMTSWPIRFQLVVSLEHYGFSKYPAPPIVVAKQLLLSSHLQFQEHHSSKMMMHATKHASS